MSNTIIFNGICKALLFVQVQQVFVGNHPNRREVLGSLAK